MITGHRKIGKSYSHDDATRVKVRNRLRNILRKVKEKYPEVIGISGMAIGIDQDFCYICIELQIPFDAYLPFEGQALIWPKPIQNEYKNLLKKARQCIIVSDGGYSPSKMHVRNKAMADECDAAIAVWDQRQIGGTASCIKYLEQLEKKVLIINPNDEYNQSHHKMNTPLRGSVT